jgi:ribosomal protein S18 acetylase RimI-like enzyme
MKTHVLDNPMWQALVSHQASFALAGQLAARYQPDLAPFAGVQQPTQAAFEELTSLIGKDEMLYLLEDEPPQLAGFHVEPHGLITQMVWQGDSTLANPTVELCRLAAPEVEEMLTLTALAFPGYFRARTYEMGDYWGIRENGLLVAMTGERFQVEDYCEVSAVCTHPDFRGRGYAEQLVCHVVTGMLRRDAVPFLHVGQTNETAKRIYAKLGFVERRDLPLWSVIRTNR